jgi:hypothetical protein
MRPQSTFLQLALVLALAIPQVGCAGSQLLGAGLGRLGPPQRGQPEQPVYQPTTTRNDIAGVWDGMFAEGPFRIFLARLIVGTDTHLFLGERGMMRLVSQGREREAFIFRGEPVHAGGPSADRVSVERQGNLPRLDVRIQWAPGSRQTNLRLTQPIDLQSVFGLRHLQGPSYFRYEDWRMRGGSGDPEAKLAEAIDMMERAGWACLFRVRRPATSAQLFVEPFEQPWPGTRVYMFYSERPNPNLVYWVGRERGVEFRLARTVQALPFPAFGVRPVMMGPIRPTFTFALREDDPVQALVSQAGLGSDEVRVYVFGPPAQQTYGRNCTGTAREFRPLSQEE